MGRHPAGLKPAGLKPAGLTPAGLTAYATPTKRKEARNNLAGFFVPTSDAALKADCIYMAADIRSDLIVLKVKSTLAAATKGQPRNCLARTVSAPVL